MNKPLEIMFYNSDSGSHMMKVFLDDGTTHELRIEELPEGFKINRHYSITDIYGNLPIDDRKEN